MTDDPREELARRVLRTTAVEMLDPASETFERLRAAGRRRRTQRRFAAAGALTVVAAAVIGLVLLVGPARSPESTLQPGGSLGNFLDASTHGRLSVGATIPLGISTSTALVAAEASDGAVFYAPRSQQDTDGQYQLGTPGTNVVRVVDGTAAPAVAEHAPGRVIGLGADSIDLYVATPTQVIRYSRKTGDEVHVWPLLHSPINTAQLVLAGRWLYVSAGFQCDACGANPNTLLAINLVTGTRRVLAIDVGPEGVAGDEQQAYYVPWNGGLVGITPTGHKQRSPHEVDGFSYVVGEFGRGVAIYEGGAAPGNNAMVHVFDPAGLRQVAQWHAGRGISAWAMVPGATGGAFVADAACGPGQSATFCSREGALGSTVSRLDVATGARSTSVRIPHLVFLYGPAPAAVTVSGSSYDLVRIR